MGVMESIYVGRRWGVTVSIFFKKMNHLRQLFLLWCGDIKNIFLFFYVAGKEKNKSKYRRTYSTISYLSSPQLLFLAPSTFLHKKKWMLQTPYLTREEKIYDIRNAGPYVYRPQPSVSPVDTIYKDRSPLTIEACNLMRRYVAVETCVSGDSPEEKKVTLMERRKGMIGASSIGNIVGYGVGIFSDYWKHCISMGNLDDPFLGNEHTDRGTRLEGLVVQTYQELTGNRVMEGNHWKMRRYPMYASSPDGKVLLGGGHSRSVAAWDFDGGLEAKTKLGNPLENITEMHMAQVQWQMMTACMCFVDYISTPVASNDATTIRRDKVLIVRVHASMAYFRWMTGIAEMFRDSIFNGIPIPEKLPHPSPLVLVQNFNPYTKTFGEKYANKPK